MYPALCASFKIVLQITFFLIAPKMFNVERFCVYKIQMMSVVTVLCVNMVTANMLLSVFFVSGELFVHSLLFGDIHHLQFGLHLETKQTEQCK